MTDQELAEMSIEDRNRILTAWAEETKADLEMAYEMEAKALWDEWVFGYGSRHYQ